VFWVYLLIAVVAFVALVGWFGRKRGSAKGKPAGDIDSGVGRTAAQSRGDTHRY
jgi:hypothetical protein